MLVYIPITEIKMKAHSYIISVFFKGTKILDLSVYRSTAQQYVLNVTLGYAYFSLLDFLITFLVVLLFDLVTFKMFILHNYFI